MSFSENVIVPANEENRELSRTEKKTSSLFEQNLNLEISSRR